MQLQSLQDEPVMGTKTQIHLYIQTHTPTSHCGSLHTCPHFLIEIFLLSLLLGTKKILCLKLAPNSKSTSITISIFQIDPCLINKIAKIASTTTGFNSVCSESLKLFLTFSIYNPANVMTVNLSLVKIKKYMLYF